MHGLEQRVDSHGNHCLCCGYGKTNQAEQCHQGDEPPDSVDESKAGCFSAESNEMLHA